MDHQGALNVNFHHYSLKKFRIGQKFALKWTKTLTDLHLYKMYTFHVSQLLIINYSR